MNTLLNNKPLPHSSINYSSSNIVSNNKEETKGTILRNKIINYSKKEDKYIFVIVHSNQCGHCKIIRDNMELLKSFKNIIMYEAGGKEGFPDFGIDTAPTLVVLKNGLWIKNHEVELLIKYLKYLRGNGIALSSGEMAKLLSSS